ncbi:MAG: hypothetical protein ACOC01_05305 [Bacteroidales bacterium]
MSNIKYIITLLICTALLFNCSNADKMMQEGNKIVDMVYAFKDSTGRLPYKLNEIGIEEKEEGPFYYDIKSDSSHFRLWYSVGLGDSHTYDSEKGRWYGPGISDNPSKNW